MVHWLPFLLLLMMTAPLNASVSTSVLEETLYFDFQKVIHSRDVQKQKSINGFSAFEQSLFVDALQDMLEEGSPEARESLKVINPLHYNLTENLRLGILKIKYGRAGFLDATLVNQLLLALRSEGVDIKLVYIMAAYEEELLSAGHDDLIALARLHKNYNDIALDQDRKVEIADDVVADLFYRSPDVASYMNGEYVKSVKIFMFCRDNRLYPCLMVMRDVHGQEVRNPDGSLWNHPALASSARGIPSYYRNGNTPAGILTIDSVMPAADQQVSFGKFRRLILNFVPKSRSESLIKSLLPPSSMDEDWWRASMVARDAGRNLLRIHGTGKINTDPSTPYFPFMRTSGCIAQKENTYEGVTYQDQRELLDDVMLAMDMEPEFNNEPKIKGILYLMDLDDKSAPVALEDLASRGID